jgi:hypothetical protein
MASMYIISMSSDHKINYLTFETINELDDFYLFFFIYSNELLISNLLFVYYRVYRYDGTKIESKDLIFSLFSLLVLLFFEKTKKLK